MTKKNLKFDIRGQKKIKIFRLRRAIVEFTLFFKNYRLRPDKFEKNFTRGDQNLGHTHSTHPYTHSTPHSTPHIHVTQYNITHIIHTYPTPYTKHKYTHIPHNTPTQLELTNHPLTHPLNQPKNSAPSPLLP